MVKISRETRMLSNSNFTNFFMFIARAENAVLTAKVKELTEKVKVLTVDNAALLAEVEMYRKEAALPNFSKLALGQADSPSNAAMMDTDDAADASDDFVRSGNGVFPSENAVTLQNLNGSANPLCCALNANDTVLATGGADSRLVLCQWGAALAPSPDASANVVQSAIGISFSAPVICVSFAVTGNYVAGGSMDGSVKVLQYEAMGQGLETSSVQVPFKHTKYVKDMVWCPTEPILATASADGNINVSKAQDATMDTIKTLHLNGTVECLAFSRDGKTLFCYARDTPYLSAFNLENDFEQTKMNLNGGTANGGFEDHVSFAVMDIAVSPDGKYLALATDVSRNIVIEIATGKQVRNLYGTSRDGIGRRDPFCLLSPASSVASQAT